MSWKKTDLVLKKSFNQKGMGDMVTAGQLCRQAELLLPDTFRAVSFRNHILHIELSRAKTMAFKLVEGKLMNELNQYAETHKLPEVKRFRLTFQEESPIL